jgi:hypothetical protein
MAALADGSGAVFRPVLPVELPAGRSGLLVRSARRAAGDAPLPVVGRDDAAVVGETSEVQFVAADRSSLGRVALGLAASHSVAVVVLCPVGVSAERSALALAVGDVLWARGGGPVVVCGVQPAAEPGRSVWSLPVLVREAGGVVTARHVWQVAAWAPVRRWLSVVGSG